MNDELVTSENGVNLIKRFEGFCGDPYLDSVKVATIGYGTTFYPDGRKVTMNDQCISEEQATEILKTTLVGFENSVRKLVKVPLNQNQFDALVCFTYNLGATNLKNSTLLKVLNEGNYAEVPNQIKRWNKAGGKVLKGLVRRREAEAELFSALPMCVKPEVV